MKTREVIGRWETLLTWLQGVPGKIDTAVSIVDDVVSSPGRFPVFGQRSLLPLLLPIPTYFFVVFGPSVVSSASAHWRGISAALAFSVALTLHLAYFVLPAFRGKAKEEPKDEAKGKAKGKSKGRWMFWLGGRWMVWLQCLTVAGLGVFVILSAPATATVNSGSLYRHTLAPLAIAIFVLAVPATQWLSKRRLFSIAPRVVRLFGRSLKRMVIESKPPRPINGWDVARGYISCLVATPLHVLLVPAMVVLLASPRYLLLEAVIAGALSFMLFACATYDPDRTTVVRLVSGAFFSSASMFVSLAVIALAVMRLAGESHVATLLDASSKRTLLSYIVSAYCLIWLYEFWTEQTVIDLLQDLPFKRSTGEGKTNPLQRHGRGSLRVSHNGNARVFEPCELLHAIARSARPCLRNFLETEATGIELKVRALLAASTISIVGILAAFFYISSGPPRPLITANGTKSGSFDLAARLEETTANPVIVIAASGGGTRAALWTAAVLHGLGRMGLLESVLVGSGVSGGSVALAYFAENRERLLSGQDIDAWERMQRVLSEPYIDDVLAGASEWRVQRGTCLGTLLAEGFARAFPSPGPSVRDFAHAPLGLILNATISADSDLSLKKDSDSRAGGRIELTNLRSPFLRTTDSSERGWPLELPMVLASDPGMLLTAAAALSANFPPVFPSAPLVLANAPPKIMATDGGALENRGVIEGLLAVEAALSELEKYGPNPSIPDIRMVVAEASAVPSDSAGDRGIGAILNAATQLANGFIGVLLTRVSTLHAAITGRQNGLRIVYVPMPFGLREAGAFGTHWMMRPEVSYVVHRDGDPNPLFIDIPAGELLKMIDLLASPDADATRLETFIGPDAQKIWPGVGETAWETLAREFGYRCVANLGALH